MKLRKVTMNAFGPYADSQTIDFTSLGQRSLFLICGPTGAGKSSVLDAICYALFGQTSGADREPERMRSDHCDPSTLTEVELEFALGGRAYRVSRAPTQEKPRQRGGDGTVTVASRATLEEITGRKRAGRVLAEKTTTVTEKIRKLLGLDVAQFRQVVMLPQGKCQELLMSKSSEREAVLEVLFSTSDYRRIEEELKRAVKDARERMEKLRDEQAFILREADCEDEKQVDEKRKETEHEHVSAGKELTLVRQRHGKALEALNAGDAIMRKLEERQDADAALAELVKRGKQAKANRETAERGRAAAALADVEAQVAKAERAVNDAGKSLRQTSGRLKKLVVGQRIAGEKLRAEKGRQAERDELKSRIDRLRETKAKAEDLAKLEEQAAESKEKSEDTTEARRRIASDLADVTKAVNADSKDSEKLAVRSADAKALLKSAEELKQRLEWLREVEEKNKELAHARASTESAHEALLKAEEETRKAHQTAEAAKEQWLKGQASRLAESLKEGKPCPVCGSTMHPHPAEMSAQIVHDAELKSLEEGVLVAQRDEKIAANREKETSNAQVALQSDLKRLEMNLKDHKEATVASAEADLAKVTMGLGEAKDAETQLTKLRARLQKAQARERELKDKLKHAESSERSAESEYAVAKTRVEEASKAVPKAHRKPVALAAAIKQCEKKLSLREKALEAAQTAEGKAASALSACRAEMKAAEQKVNAARKSLLAGEKAFKARIKGAGFTSLKDYENSVLPAAQIKKLIDSAGKYDKAVAAAKDRQRRAVASTRGVQAPDMRKLKATEARAQSDVDEALKHEQSLGKFTKDLARWGKRLESLGNQTRKLDAKHGVIGRLAEVAAGKNPRRVNFQRYVQAIHLDRVLHKANDRLRRMTGGRYILQRAEEEEDRKATGGLNIIVLDHITQKMRPVNTLSGGETFQASLSLALGLADVVTSQSGGMKLDTIFVDEGFGSLDSDALDLAISMLQEIERGGRTVGIISHVPELRERFAECRLEVTPGSRGSQARFVLA